MKPIVTSAGIADIDTYVAFAREAQSFIDAQGLEQWVPAAHEPFRPELEEKVKAGSLHKVLVLGATVAFFDLSSSSIWWRSDDTPALYVSGVVVARSGKGQALGHFILDWCCSTAVARSAHVLRLDCHAGNGKLCAYYRDYGFHEVDRVEQHPGYTGVLFEREVR